MTARFSIYRKDDYISANYSNQDDAAAAAPAAACTSCMCVRIRIRIGGWDAGPMVDPKQTQREQSVFLPSYASAIFFSTRHTRSFPRAILAYGC